MSCKRTRKDGTPCDCTEFEAGLFKPDKCKTCAHKAKDHPGASTEIKSAEIAKTAVASVEQGLVRSRKESLAVDGSAAAGGEAAARGEAAASTVVKGLVSDRAGVFEGKKEEEKKEKKEKKDKKEKKKEDDGAAEKKKKEEEEAAAKKKKEEEEAAAAAAEQKRKEEEEAAAKKKKEEEEAAAAAAAAKKKEEEEEKRRQKAAAEEEKRKKKEEEARRKAEEEEEKRRQKEEAAAKKKQQDEEEAARRKAEAEARIVAGVGLYVEQAGKGPLIIKDVKNGGAAAKDGRLKVGDQITAIDGVKCVNVNDMRQRILGKINTTVVVSYISLATGDKGDLTLTRTPIDE